MNTHYHNKKNVSILIVLLLFSIPFIKVDELTSKRVNGLTCKQVNGLTCPPVNLFTVFYKKSKKINSSLLLIFTKTSITKMI
jgi:hypothetical protein